MNWICVTPIKESFRILIREDQIEWLREMKDPKATMILVAHKISTTYEVKESFDNIHC